jgi:hypothetical protein
MSIHPTHHQAKPKEVITIKDTNALRIMLLLVLILLCIGANILLALRNKTSEGEKEHLPCSALPLRSVEEHPSCAEELLKAMNITNVHVVPYNATQRVPGNRTLLRAGDRSRPARGDP